MTATPRHPLVVTEALMVRSTTAAEMLGVSVRTLRRLDSTGTIPQAIKLGGVKVWSVSALADFVADGCPSRDASKQNAVTAGKLGRRQTTGASDDSNPA